MSTFPIPIDAQVKQITSSVFDGASSRDIAIALEANQAYIDYLDWLKDNTTFDESVTIEVDGVRVKFKNDDDFANFLVERME